MIQVLYKNNGINRTYIEGTLLGNKQYRTQLIRKVSKYWRGLFINYSRTTRQHCRKFLSIATL
jgi:hypothetical protein